MCYTDYTEDFFNYGFMFSSCLDGKMVLDYEFIDKRFGELSPIDLLSK